ncbi:hypothetical protein [Lacticigenium naphthae]|uniref:hypothetical protein n=1 Tax=Lacticigenium naphthae TaxID=515351 RepID=UPI0003FF4F1D|nr:hypothetical protein [Lacticigenium naphthae]
MLEKIWTVAEESLEKVSNEQAEKEEYPVFTIEIERIDGTKNKFTGSYNQTGLRAGFRFVF